VSCDVRTFLQPTEADQRPSVHAISIRGYTAGMPERPRVIVWAQRGQETLVTETIEHAGLELAAVVAPTPSDAAALADSMGVERIGDLRQAAQRENIDLLWLAAPARIEADARRAIREAAFPAVSSEARPAVIAEIAMDPAEAGTARFVPLMRESPGCRSAIDVREDLGVLHAISITIGCRPGEGTLFARIFDAMDLLDTLCGPAEGIAANLAGSASSVPETLADLDGAMTVNVRFATGATACIWASNTAPRWFRRVTVLGEGGLLQATDADHAWHAGDGGAIDADLERHVSPATLIGDAIKRVLERRDTPEVPPDTARIIALCEAARLSCRTAQVEIPGKLLETLRRV